MNITKIRFIAPIIISGLILTSLDFSKNTQAYSVPETKTVSFERLQGIEIKKIDRSKMLSKKELKSILASVGFKGEALKQAWAIAMKESTGRPYSHNQNRKTGDNSYGLFQINMIDSLGPARRKQFGISSNEMLFDPVINAKIAYKMSNKGKNWSAWGGISKRVLHFMSKFEV
jgi:hypothetical protein